jgi:2-polyprenyl-3-methyl-5-hydroxy-6-metoxy-1,4-benzoquinol methylase
MSRKMLKNDEGGLHSRESRFHDAWASDTPLDQIRVRECFESPTAVENRFILQLMGPLHGKKLLDIGAGLGESSVYFALQGAEVTTVDISAAMVETALRLAKLNGVELKGVVSAGENLRLPNEYYDVVYIANTIHHVHDRSSLFAQIRAALKPGGRFFAYDPLAYNPLIQIYRRMATAVRTPDESPLTAADVHQAKKYFSNVGHREFWLLSLGLFVKYYLVDRVHPNQDRYWKRILGETRRGLWWWLPLRALDSVLTRLPLVRWLAWNVVIWGQKEST